MTDDELRDLLVEHGALLARVDERTTEMRTDVTEMRTDFRALRTAVFDGEDALLPRTIKAEAEIVALKEQKTSWLSLKTAAVAGGFSLLVAIVGLLKGCG